MAAGAAHLAPGLACVVTYLAFLGLGAAQRLGDERVGQDQLGLGHVADRQHDLGRITRRIGPSLRSCIDLGAVVAQAHGVTLRRRPACRGNRLRPSTRHRHLDLHDLAGMTLEIGTPHQRPVDPGRRYLEPVGAVDRIGSSSTGDSAREAASQSSTSKVPSGRSAITWTVQPSAPETRTRTTPEAECASAGSRNRGNARRAPVSAISAAPCVRPCFRQLGFCCVRSRSSVKCSTARLHASRRSRGAQVIKKSGSRAGPTLTNRSDHIDRYEMSN